MSKQLTIVIIRALGYSGATWVNVILGCHKQTMAMGPPNRFWKLSPGMADQACMIHRERCSVWPELLTNPPDPKNWFNTIYEATGKDIFILNYPDKAFYETVIKPLDARILHIKLVRDGRANLFSRMRHKYGESKTSAFRNIIEWQIPKTRQVEQKLPSDPADYYFLRYEDLVNTPEKTMPGLGNYIGVDYDTRSALKFWDWEHHLTAGNTGMLDMICELQGLPGYHHSRKEVYDEIIKRVNSGEPVFYIDESWRDGLTREDLLAFDCLYGEQNAINGYERDKFDMAEIEAFWTAFDTQFAELPCVEIADTPGGMAKCISMLGNRMLDITSQGVYRILDRLI